MINRVNIVQQYDKVSPQLRYCYPVEAKRKQRYIFEMTFFISCSVYGQYVYLILSSKTQLLVLRINFKNFIWLVFLLCSKNPSYNERVPCYS